MDLKHFSHPHPLIYEETPPASVETLICSGCNLHILSDCPTYLCWQCQFFLHDRCYGAARSLSHPSHSSHPLSLFPYPTYSSGTFICHSCNQLGTAFSYCCACCDFDLHVHCALNTISNFTPIIYPSVSAPNMFLTHQTPNFGDANIQYQNNFPPVPTQYTNTQYPNTLTHIHENVIPDQSIYHPSQAQYSNTHFPPTPESVSYPTVPASAPASFQTVNQPAGVPAGGEPPPAQPKGVKHFSHEHLLDLGKVNQKEIMCSGCAKEVSGLTYRCTSSDCTFDLHRECFGLPRELKHKSHQEHPLTLLTVPAYKEGNATCNACLYEITKSFAYHCSTCKFDLHVTCAFLPQTMKRDDHPHSLAIIHSLPDYKEEGKVDAFCDVCLEVVDVKNSWFYLCQECDFGTHLDCVKAKVPTEAEKTKEELLAAALIELQVLELQEKLSKLNANFQV